MENEIISYVMDTPGNTNPAILEQMLDANSGTKLPEPTLEDNGKVLGVAEGQYAFISGGGGMHIVDATADSSYYTTLSETFGTIKAAFLGGSVIVVRTADEYATTYISVIQIQCNPEEGGDVYLAGLEQPLHAATDADYPTDAVSDNGDNPDLA